VGQAIDYALGQWSTLEIFLEQGRVEDRQQPGRKRDSTDGGYCAATAFFGDRRFRGDFAEVLRTST